MAIALSRARTAAAPRRTPRGVLGLAALPAALSLVGSLETVVPLGGATLWASILAAAALAVCAVRCPQAWLWAGAFALAAAAYVNWSGGVVGPALTVLALVALGAGGGFVDESSHRSLMDALAVGSAPPTLTSVEVHATLDETQPEAQHAG